MNPKFSLTNKEGCGGGEGPSEETVFPAVSAAHRVSLPEVACSPESELLYTHWLPTVTMGTPLAGLRSRHWALLDRSLGLVGRVRGGAGWGWAGSLEAPGG